MGERYPNDSQLETMFADYQRLKEENAALRRLLVENGITIPAQPRSSPPPPAKGMCTMLESMSAQAKTQRSPCSVVCSVDGKMCMAVRMRFKSGEWGYVPDSIRDWKAVLSAEVAL